MTRLLSYVVLFVAANFAAAADFSFPPAGEQEFLEGVRRRQLFALAEHHCEQQLRRADLTSRDRTGWTLELMKTHAEQALQLSGEPRVVSWQQAEQVATRFLESSPGEAAEWLIRIQQGLTRLQRGEVSRLEAELRGESATMEEIREQLRAATNLLRDVARELERAAAGDGGAETLTFSEQELAAVRRHVHHQLGRAQRELALTYDEASRDRQALLNDAIRAFDQLLRELPETTAGGEILRLEQARTLRLANQLEAATPLLKQLDTPSVSAATRVAHRAEQIRWHLAAEQLEQARQLSEATSPHQDTADLDFAIFQTYVRLWVEAIDAARPAEEEQRRQQALAAASAMGTEHGPYWARRADLELVRSGTREAHGSWQILALTADDLFRQGKFDEAAATYDQAETVADQPQTAFEFGYKAALILQQQKRHQEASQRWQSLAVKYPQDPRAANAHLLAAYEAAQAVASGNGTLEEYLKLLEDQLSRWPRQADTAQAALWLADWHAQQDEQDAAASTLWQAAQIEQADPSLRQVIFDRAIQHQLQAWQESPTPPPADEVSNVARQLEHFFWENAAGGELRETWDKPARAAGRAYLRLALHYFGNLDLASRIASALKEVDSDSFATQLLEHAVRHARSKNEAEPLSSLNWQSGSDAIAYELLNSLASTSQSRSAVWNGELAVVLIQRGNLDADQQSSARRIRIESLTLAGEHQTALWESAALASDFPDQQWAQVLYAELLSSGDDPVNLSIALKQWRLVAARSRPRTLAWYEAKLQVARMMLRRGDAEGSAKLIRYLQATEDLEATGLATEFAELLEKAAP